jgi:outer membrane protein assembly factor BamB
MPSRFARTALGALAALLLAAMPARAQEWTRFRGPNGTGISSATTVPVQFTEKDFNWKVQLPGVGHSSPVLWGKKLFLTSAEAASGKRHLVCLNAADGKLLWLRTHTFPSYATHKLNNFASGTPAVDAENVYVIFGTAESFVVHAYDHSGKPLWQQDLGSFSVQHGAGNSPVVVGDIVIVAKEPDMAEGVIAGLDRKTGAVRWKRERPSREVPYATPLIYQPKDGPAEVIIANGVHGLTSLDPRTGETNWQTKEGFKVRTVASPVLLPNGLLFQTAGNGGGVRQAVAVKPGSKKSGEPGTVAYTVTRAVSYVPTPIVVGDRLYMWGDAGIVTCMKADTGDVVWSERAEGNFFGSPVCVNGKLYAISQKGELVVIDTGDQFKPLARIDLGETSHATPAVADGVMYLRTETHLISVGGKK